MLPFKSAVAAAGVIACVMSSPVAADPIVLTFEGIGDASPVGDFYNGGSGANYGVQFSANARGLVDSDAGGTGDFANEPSGDTVLNFGPGYQILDLVSGFTTGFSFFYSSASALSVTVYNGMDGSGGVLGTLFLLGQYNGNNCAGDPTGSFCNWTAAGLAFAGTARSIVFNATGSTSAFDDVTFGSVVPGGTTTTTVPEPPTPVMLALGLTGLGFVARRRRKSSY